VLKCMCFESEWCDMNEECDGCGSTLKDRKDYVSDNELDHNDETLFQTKHCPHCDGIKCIMCDMGNDCSCINCEGE